MEIRSYKLPPLPNKKYAPIQIQLRSQKLVLLQNHLNSRSSQRPTSASKQKKIQRNSSIKRIGSAHASSRSSKNSNLSRDSSIEKYNYINNDIKVRMSMPNITAKSWAVYQITQQKFIYGKRMFKKRQIASLTKIINLITILNILEVYSLCPKKIKLRVSKQSSCMIGTTAQIKYNMQLTLYDLFYGMMLPSGNDAAYQIAQIGGSLILMNKQEGQIDKNIIYDVNRMTEYYHRQTKAVNVYLHQMNKMCKAAKMRNSHFVNPHGLSNTDTYSTAEDVCRLCIFAMGNQKFRQVVTTKFYTCCYTTFLQLKDQQNKQNEQINQKKYQQVQGKLVWENTNRLLNHGWSGIKTGITPNAGPCLAASTKRVISKKQYEFIVVLIKSNSMEERWSEVEDIVDWVIRQNLFI